MFPSTKLFRTMLTGFCLWLAVVMGATSIMAAEVSCDDWNTQKFFMGADESDISRCLKAGSRPDLAEHIQRRRSPSQSCGLQQESGGRCGAGESGSRPERAEFV